MAKPYVVEQNQVLMDLSHIADMRDHRNIKDPGQKTDGQELADSRDARAVAARAGGGGVWGARVWSLACGGANSAIESGAMMPALTGPVATGPYQGRNCACRQARTNLNAPAYTPSN